VALLVSAVPALAGVRLTSVRFFRAMLTRREGSILPQSAALFIGVRDYVYDDTLTEVRYAVDDAIDLAYVLAIDRETRLVTPERVVLALSVIRRSRSRSEASTPSSPPEPRCIRQRNPMS